jgi:ribonuclease P/MRP protein subunit RPP1
MRFVDLHTHSIFSSGVDSPARLLYHAKELRIEIGICDGIRYECPSGVEVEIKGKKDLDKKVKKFDEMDYIIVHGGKESVNRAAVSDSRVGILAHPDRGRRDSGIDSFISRKAAENDVAIEVNLSSLTSTKWNARVYALKNIKRNLMLSRKYGFDIIVSTGAKSNLDLRSSDVVREILTAIGFTEEEIKMSMEEVPRKKLRKT